MEPWTNEIKELYRTPGNYKEYRGYSNGELVFDGSNIVADSLNITQSISDSEQIRYGTVEASMLEVRLADSGAFPISIAPSNPMQLATNAAEPVYTALPENKKYMLRTDELKGAEIELKQVIGEQEVPIGVFAVDECPREADTWFIKIVAYDRLARFNQDVAAWYNDPATWPYTTSTWKANFLGGLFASLCNYVGVPYENAWVTNDAKTIYKTIDPSSITGTDVLSAICELNGRWPQMSPEGVLRRVGLGVDSSETFDYEVYEQVYRPDSTREGFVCKAINAVVIRETEDDIGGHYPETLQDNPYIIQDNFLLYGRSTADLEGFAQNIYNDIKDKPYKPHNTLADGRPYLQCGDMITVRTQKETFNTFILKRTLKGEAGLIDSYEAQGTEKQAQEYGISRQIIQLQSKTNKLIRTVDETVSEVASKVGNDEIISRINQTAEEVKILAQRISLEGIVTANSRFKILADGSMEAVNADLSGKVTATSGRIASFNISSTSLYAGTDLDNQIELYSGSSSAGIVIGPGAITYDSTTDPEGTVMHKSGISLGGFNLIAQSRILFTSTPPSAGGTANARLVERDSGGYSLGLVSSSRRYKKRIQPVNPEGLAEKIDRISAVTYEPRAGMEKGHAFYGFIAEDMEQEFPWLVDYTTVNGVIDAQSVEYDRVPAVLWTDAQNTHAELKRQDAEIEDLKAESVRMHAEIAELKEDIAKILEGRADDGATLSK